MKIAVVTGASTGIGRAVAVALASQGYFIYLLARNEERLAETKKLITGDGGQAEIITTDLSSIDSINKSIKTIKEKTDRIDLLVNVAGIWHGSDEVFANKDLESFDQKTIMDTFFVGTIAPTLLSHAFIPYMVYGAKIINISGTFENGAKGWLPYYVSKRAIEDLTVALSQELEEKGIQVNGISPSDTATDTYAKFFPEYMSDAIAPYEIAKAILLLADPSNSVSGKIFVIKKGQEISEGFHS